MTRSPKIHWRTLRKLRTDIKSEQDTFIKDLDQLYSHMAGSHGIDECVKILKIEAKWDYWIAHAKHISSPDKVIWDSRTGSSLKKG